MDLRQQLLACSHVFPDALLHPIFLLGCCSFLPPFTLFILPSPLPLPLPSANLRACLHMCVYAPASSSLTYMHKSMEARGLRASTNTSAAPSSAPPTTTHIRTCTCARQHMHSQRTHQPAHAPPAHAPSALTPAPTPHAHILDHTRNPQLCPPYSLPPHSDQASFPFFSPTPRPACLPACLTHLGPGGWPCGPMPTGAAPPVQPAPMRHSHWRAPCFHPPRACTRRCSPAVAAGMPWRRGTLRVQGYFLCYYCCCC